MRPHNGWWQGSSTPRRWIDLVQEPAAREDDVENIAVPAQAGQAELPGLVPGPNSDS